MASNLTISSIPGWNDYNGTLDCGNWKDHGIMLTGSSWLDYLFDWYPIIFCIIGLPGLLCNATSIWILIKKRYIEETFNFLMTMVLFMDSFAILVMIFDQIQRIFKKHNDLNLILSTYFLWPFSTIFSQGSTFMIVSMAFERYFASRNPLSTHQATKCNNFLKYVLPAIILAIIPHIVKFLEYELEEDKYGYGNSKYNLKETDLKAHPAYHIINVIVCFLLRGIIPMSLLTFFSYKIYNGAKKQDQYLSMSSDSAISEDATPHRQEIFFAKVSMGVILIYLACTIPSSFLEMYEMTHLSDMYACKKADQQYLKLHSVGYFFTLITFRILGVLNLSTHSVIYILLNKPFRLDFANLFKPWFKKCVLCVVGSILGGILGSILGFILGGKDGGILGGLFGAFIGGVCRLDFTNLFKPCCKKCVAQDINTDVAVSMGSIETHIDIE